MTEKKVSEIEAYSKPDKSKSGRWGITFGETDEEGKNIWYNSFEGFPDFIDKGVVVKVEYEENEKYNSRDIKSIELQDTAEKSRQESIREMHEQKLEVKKRCKALEAASQVKPEMKNNEVIVAFNKFKEILDEEELQD